MFRNSLNNLVLIIGLIIFSVLVLGLVGCWKDEDSSTVTGSSGSSSDFDQERASLQVLSEPLPPLPLDATGKEFVWNRELFTNLKITSSEEVHIVLEAFPKLEDGKFTDIGGMISIHIEPVSITTKTETQLTISGLESFWQDGEPIPLFRYQEGYLKEEFKVDSEGRYTFTQDISELHHIWIVSEQFTLYLGTDLETGPPSPYYDYDPKARTYKFKKNYTGTIVVVSDHITLDGQGHTITGGSGWFGVYLDKRVGVTVEGYYLTNYFYGIYLASYCRNNIIRNNTLVSNGDGICVVYECSSNEFSGNTILSNFWWGIVLGEGCCFNSIKGNNIRENHDGGIWLHYGLDRPRNNYIYENDIINHNWNGVALAYDVYPLYFWHNNIYNNGGWYIWCNFYVNDSRDRELSYHGQGNFWGHTSWPGFYRYGGAHKPYDCNNWHTRDSHPYLVYDGWKKGYNPGEIMDTTPP